jgi:hypothetical protein
MNYRSRCAAAARGVPGFTENIVVSTVSVSFCVLIHQIQNRNLKEEERKKERKGPPEE